MIKVVVTAMGKPLGGSMLSGTTGPTDLRRQGELWARDQRTCGGKGNYENRTGTMGAGRELWERDSNYRNGTGTMGMGRETMGKG